MKYSFYEEIRLSSPPIFSTACFAFSDALETSIDSKTDVAGLEAMTVFTEEMQDAGKKASEFNDWPVNPRESAV